MDGFNVGSMWVNAIAPSISPMNERSPRPRHGSILACSFFVPMWVFEP